VSWRDSIIRFLALPSKSGTAEREPSIQTLNSESVAWAEVSSILAQYKYNPDELIGRKGFDIYRRMMFDEQVKSVMYFKRSTVTGREWQFELDHEKNKGVTQAEAKRRVDLFTTMLQSGYRGPQVDGTYVGGSFTDGMNAIMKAQWQGYSMTEQMFGTFEHAGKSWWGVEDLRAKPFDTFFPVVNDKGDVLRWVQRSPAMRDVRLDMTKFVYYRHNPDADEHYGQSDLRAAYRAYLSKDIAIRYRNIFMERLAGGFVVMKPKEGHALTRGSPEWNALTNILTNLSGKSGVILPGGIDIEVVYAPGSQVSVFKESTDQDDMAIARAALVPNLLGVTPAGQTGSYSQADTQFDVFMIVSDSEAGRLEEALNEQIFGPLGRVNFKDGIAPRFKFKPLSKRQVAHVLTMWKDLLAAGAVQASDTDEKHLRKVLEIPEKGELLEDPTAAAPPTRSTPTPPDEGERGERRPVGRGDESDEDRDAREQMRRAKFHGSPGDPDYPHDDGGGSSSGRTDQFLELDRVATGVGTVEVGPIRVIAYRVGSTDDPGRGVFLGDSPESVEPYKSLHEGHEIIRYRVDAKNALIADSQASLHRYLYDKSLQDAVWSEDKKSGFKDSIQAFRKVEARMARDLRRRGFDAIVYRSPPAPAKHEIAVIGKSAVLTKFSREGVREQAHRTAFARAEQRVAFKVIERQSEGEVARNLQLVEEAVAELVAEGLARIEIESIGSTPESADAVRRFDLDAMKTQHLNTALRRALRSGMDVGQAHATREVSSAKGIEFSRRLDMQRLGDLAAEWLKAKSFTIAGDIKAGAVKEIKNVLVTALKRNQSQREIRQNVYRGLVDKGFLGGRAAAEALGVGDTETLAQLLELKGGLEPYRLDTVIRTNMFEAINEARLNAFTDPALDGFVRALEYSAILDGRTTAVCEHMDGRTYTTGRWEDDLRPWVPPNHFNCRSLLIPVTAADEAALTEEVPSVEPQEGFG
jgi:SPP1 gp7 family putative phage head morphogenesis protein